MPARRSPRALHTILRPPPQPVASVAAMDARGSRDRRVLVVEDDTAIADAVRRRLESEGYTVDVVHDGQAAVEAAEAPRATTSSCSTSCCRAWTGSRSAGRCRPGCPVPVLMLTARAEETDRLIGLAVGADDYLTKPFSPRELVARVAALLRRVDRAAELAARRDDGPGSAVLAVGGLEVDPAARRVRRRRGAGPPHPDRVRPARPARRAARGGGRPRAAARRRCGTGPRTTARPPGCGRPARSTATSRRCAASSGADRIRTVTGVGYALEVPR